MQGRCISDDIIHHGLSEIPFKKIIYLHMYMRYVHVIQDKSLKTWAYSVSFGTQIQHGVEG